MRVPHVSTRWISCKIVQERVVRQDGALRHKRDSVHVRGRPLIHPMPVDCNALAVVFVNYLNLNGISFANLELSVMNLRLIEVGGQP